MLFFDPGDSAQLASAVINLFEDHDLFEYLQVSSLNIAKERTLEKSVANLIEHLEKNNIVSIKQ